MSIKEKGFVFEEYQLDTDFEQYEVTDFYIRESQKIKQGIYTAKYNNTENDDDDDEGDDVN